MTCVCLEGSSVELEVVGGVVRSSAVDVALFEGVCSRVVRSSAVSSNPTVKATTIRAVRRSGVVVVRSEERSELNAR